MELVKNCFSFYIISKLILVFSFFHHTGWYLSKKLKCFIITKSANQRDFIRHLKGSR